MTHEHTTGEDATKYYPVVSRKVAQEITKLWHQDPRRMSIRTRAQIGEFSPNLIQLLDILEKFGNASLDVPVGTGHTISDGMMHAFSMLLKQTDVDHQKLIHLQFDPYEFSDKELPAWGLLETARKPRPQITIKDIVTPFLAQNKELAQIIIEDSRTRANSTYFVAGAALVSQLYYEASYPQEKK